MEEWKEYKYSEIATLIGGGTPKTSNALYWGGNIPWLSVKDFCGDSKYVYNTEKHITELGLNNSSTKLLSKGDIIISARGTIGELAMLPYDMAFNQSCFGIRNKKDIVTSDFLYYLTKTKIKELQKSSHGSVFDTITRETFERIICLIPPLPEQCRIAAILSSLDAKIELNRRINDNLEQQAQALFRSWFVDFEPFGGVMPKDWKTGKLSDIIEILSGFAFKSNTFEPKGKYTLVTIKAVQDGSLELNGADSINEVPNNIPSHCFLKEKDILLSLTGNVGRCCIVNTNKLLLNQRVASIKPKNPTDWAYSYILFRMPETKFYLESISRGTAQANLSPIETAYMPIFIPPRSIMDSFARFGNQLLNYAVSLAKENSCLSSLRDTLLPKLMSGEIKVNEINA